jgi:transposase
MAGDQEQIGIAEKEVAVKQILAGEKSRIDVARELGVSRQAVSIWVKKSSAGEAFSGSRGRPVMVPLTDSEKREGQKTIQRSAPSQEGIDAEGDRWTYEAVRKLLKKQRGRLYTRTFIEPLMYEWGLTDPSLFPPEKLSNRIQGEKPKTEHRQMSTDDLSYYEEQVRQTQSMMKDKGIVMEETSRYAHGVRTGKHSKGQTKPSKKKKKRKQKRRRR